MLDHNLALYLQRIGAYTLPVNLFFLVIVQSILYGMSIPIFIYAAKVLRTRGLKSGTSKVTALASATGFVLLTLVLGSGMPAGFIPINISALVTTQSTKDVSLSLNIISSKVQPIKDTAQGIMLYVSDVIVLWRASILLPESPGAIVLLALLWVAGLACLIAKTVITTPYANFILYSSGVFPKGNALNFAFRYISLLINLVATILICYRLWSHRRFLGPSIRTWTSAQRTLSLLVETGGFFCFLQVVERLLDLMTYLGFTISSAHNNNLNLISKIIIQSFNDAVFTFSAVYPVLIIVLIDMKKTVGDSIDLSTVVELENIDP